MFYTCRHSRRRTECEHEYRVPVEQSDYLDSGTRTNRNHSVLEYPAGGFLSNAVRGGRGPDDATCRFRRFLPAY